MSASSSPVLSPEILQGIKVAIATWVAIHPERDDPFLDRLFMEEYIDQDTYDDIFDGGPAFEDLYQRTKARIAKIEQIFQDKQYFPYTKNWKNFPVNEELIEQLFEAAIRPNFVEFLNSSYPLMRVINVGLRTLYSMTAENLQKEWDMEKFSPRLIESLPPAECLKRAAKYGRREWVIKYLTNYDFTDDQLGMALRFSAGGVEDPDIIKVFFDKFKDTNAMKTFMGAAAADSAAAGHKGGFRIIYKDTRAEFALTYIFLTAVYSGNLTFIENSHASDDPELFHKAIWAALGLDEIPGIGPINQGGDFYLAKAYRDARERGLFIRTKYPHADRETVIKMLEMFIPEADLTDKQLDDIAKIAIENGFEDLIGNVIPYGSARVDDEPETDLDRLEQVIEAVIKTNGKKSWLKTGVIDLEKYHRLIGDYSDDEFNVRLLKFAARYSDLFFEYLLKAVKFSSQSIAEAFGPIFDRTIWYDIRKFLDGSRFDEAIGQIPVPTLKKVLIGGVFGHIKERPQLIKLHRTIGDYEDSEFNRKLFMTDAQASKYLIDYLFDNIKFSEESIIEFLDDAIDKRNRDSIDILLDYGNLSPDIIEEYVKKADEVIPGFEDRYRRENA